MGVPSSTYCANMFLVCLRPAEAPSHKVRVNQYRMQNDRWRYQHSPFPWFCVTGNQSELWAGIAYSRPPNDSPLGTNNAPKTVQHDTGVHAYRTRYCPSRAAVPHSNPVHSGSQMRISRNVQIWQRRKFCCRHHGFVCNAFFASIVGTLGAFLTRKAAIHVWSSNCSHLPSLD